VVGVRELMHREQSSARWSRPERAARRCSTRRSTFTIALQDR